ncbi:hypothetical protein D3C77_383630 [compost metagenome]
MNEELALKVIRELAAAEELYRETLKVYGDDMHDLLAYQKLKNAGDRARAFIVEFSE